MSGSVPHAAEARRPLRSPRGGEPSAREAPRNLPNRRLHPPPRKPAAPSSSSFCQPEPSEAAAATQPADIAMSPGHRARAGMVKEKGGLVHSGYEALSLPMAAQRNKPLICCELGLVQSLSQPERIGHAF